MSYARLSHTELRELFEDQIRGLSIAELGDNDIDRNLTSLTNANIVLDRDMISSLLERYDIVFLYLEALRESGVTNMGSKWVKYLLRNQFNTLRESEDTLYLCWAAFALLGTEINDIPDSIAFQRRTRAFFARVESVKRRRE
ncbi:MAG: hypothetical protein EOP45_13035 [Sphingobacteriaceae bacterium]|nr:MAG: hypothetical protein EOP45_13035 [Sphingobacteriaceae bacterium]